MKLISGVSHMHARAVGFTAKTNNAPPQICASGPDVWNEPPPKVFSPPIDIASGTTITWTCAYDNETQSPMTFGEHASNNEMCIFSGIFYTTDMANQGVPINVGGGF